MDWYEMSNPAVMQLIGQRIKEIRLRKNMTQQEIATRAGISALSVVNLEKGKYVSLSILIPILRELRHLDKFDFLLPEPPVSPILLKKLQGKKRQRARK